MRPNDRMLHWWIAVDLGLGERKGTLTATEVKDYAAAVDAVPDRRAQRVPGRSGTGKLGITQR
jgi:hypothetical protein